ncbi:MAG: efflux RND transporter periplasmic adaptor subunit [Bdellovibrionales bacterium]
MAKTKNKPSKADDHNSNDQENRSHRGENSLFWGLVQLVLVFAFVFGSFAVSGILKSGKKEAKERVVEERILFAKTETISPDSFRIAFDTTGIIAARANIEVTPQVSGKIVSVNDAFFEGGTFEANDVLFVIEPLDFELEIRRLESQVAQARTAFNLEEAESKAAIADWKQVNGKKPVPSLVARKPQKAEAWANLKAAKAQLENAKLDLARSQFSLPFAGRVLSASAEVGQFVNAGQSYGSVYDAKNLEVQVSLKDEHLKWLLQTETPEITISYEHLGQTKTLEGFLKRGVTSLNNQTRFARVSFGIKDPPDDILPGVFVTLNIKGPTVKDTLSVPIGALQKNDTVWILNDKNEIFSLSLKRIFGNDDIVVYAGAHTPFRIVTSKMPGAVEGMTIRTSFDDNGAQ